MTIDIILILTGIIISTIAIAIGIGGGILWTPLLILVYNLSPQEAIATSLLIQVVGMGSGSLVYIKTNKVIPRLTFTFILAALPGVIIGSYMTVKLPEDYIQMALGIMSMLLAILFVSGNDNVDSDNKYNYTQKDINSILPIPAFFGFVMGSLSLGIAEWLIPVLKGKLKIGMTKAIATVIPMMFVLAIVASFIHWLLADNINYNYFLWGSVGTLIGGQIGARISSKVNERLLKQSFIYLMTLIGLHLIYQSL